MLVFEHPILGRLDINRAHIAEVHSSVAEPAERPSVGEPSVATPTPLEAEAHARPARLIDKWLEEWDSHFELGLSGTDGNSETSNLRQGFSARHETDKAKWLLDSVYYYGTSQGETTRHEFKADVIREWLIPNSAWFTFFQGTYEFHEFRAWERRLSGFGGVGYEFLKTDRLELIGRLGSGVVKEFSGAEELRPEGLISAAVAKWKPTDDQTVTASVTFYPDLGDFGEFRVTSKLDWAVKLNKADTLSLKIGLDNEYESQTDGDTKHNDVKYYGALVIDF